MKKTLMGVLIFGSVSNFAATTCESELNAKEVAKIIITNKYERDITSRSIVGADDVSYERCLQLASYVHNYNTDLEISKRDVVIFTDEDGSKRKIILKD